MTIPDGLCQCGCGEKTALMPHNNKKAGRVKGQPYRFVHGHAKRKHQPTYTLTDTGYKTPCWLWNGRKIGKGYAAMDDGPRGHKTGILVHVKNWTDMHGPVPEGLVLDHLCNQKHCVNPEHVEPKSNAENCRRGKSAKLNWNDVALIRSTNLPTTFLCAYFNVSQTCIDNIRAYRTWV